MIVLKIFTNDDQFPLHMIFMNDKYFDGYNGQLSQCQNSDRKNGKGRKSNVYVSERALYALA